MIAIVEVPEEPRDERYVLNLPLTADPNDEAIIEPQVVYEMRTPDARAVADLLAMQQDLTFVCEACDLLLDLPTHDPQLRATLARALWSSALVAYVRCFGTGKRLGLSEEDIRRVSQSEEAVEFHRKMRELRSKHIAHSVNPLEFIKIGIMVGTLSRNDEEGVTGLVTLSSAEWEPHTTNVNGLHRLAAGLLGVVADRAEEQTPALREVADEVGLDKIKRWPELVYPRGPVAPGAVREQ